MALKRIAILTNYPADGVNFSGGVETATAYLLEGFENRNHDFEFHVISLSKEVKKDQYSARNGIWFHCLAVPRNPMLKPHLLYNVIHCLSLLNKLKPDLVHCQDNVVLALAAAIGGFNRLFTVHGIRKVEARLWKGRSFWSHQSDRIVEWLVHRSYRFFIGASPYVGSLISRRKQLFISPNPVSEHFFAIGDAESSHDGGEILFIGSLIHLKQVHVLISAYARLVKEFKDLRLNICGSKDDANYFQDLTNAIGAKGLTGVRFYHKLPAISVRNIIATASVFVLPSVQENSPMTIAEAMAAGVPVVASRVGGIPYMIEHGKTGMLFSAGDTDELAACIKTLLVDKELAARIRKNARQQAVENYRCRDIARRHIAIYRELLGSAG